MFVDRVNVGIEAGDGGNGYVSFRQEKFIDRGGPDGGDGGKGGSIVLVASRNQNTLANFRFQRALKAPDGEPGFKQRMHGRSGIDLKVPVPVGTVVLTEDGIELADLNEDGQEFVVAAGGKGGFGNAHFVSSVRQAPKVAERGEAGDRLNAVFELRMIADVGLVGLPNAGKSTLLSVISNAKPEIANYPFTTLTPNLGVVDVDKGSSLLIADIPGLIEGASEGKGLGDEFLRHVERTKVLIHLIDAYQDDIPAAYKTIQKELHDYKNDLSTKPQVVVITKIEGLDDEIVADLLKQLKKLVPAKTPLMAISAQSGQGVKELLYAVKKQVTAIEKLEKAAKDEEDATPVYRLQPTETSFRVTNHGDYFTVTGHRIEKFASRTHFDDEEGERRLKDIMKKMGIMRELERQGIIPGQKVIVGSYGDIEY
ncbi:MAG: obg [Candidatus Saccharibacteria bacterium]|nr:obg [Candidatus Saccharibacteria bacterium]